MARRRVVVTGMGVVTPLGHSVGEMFANLVEGRSGVDPITHFDARTFPTTFAAEVKNFDLGRFVKDASRFGKCGLDTRFALAASKQALEDANLLGGVGLDRTRIGVYVGAGEGQEDFATVVCGTGTAAMSN